MSGLPTPTPAQEAATTPPAAPFKPNTASQTAKDCPVATAEAAREFTTLVKSTHTPKTLGLSYQELDSMICDCTYEDGQLLLSFWRSSRRGPARARALPRQRHTRERS